MTPYQFVITVSLYLSIVACSFSGEYLFTAFFFYALYVFWNIEELGKMESMAIICYTLLLIGATIWLDLGYPIVSGIICLVFIAGSAYVQLSGDPKII